MSTDETLAIKIDLEEVKRINETNPQIKEIFEHLDTIEIESLEDIINELKNSYEDLDITQIVHIGIAYIKSGRTSEVIIG